MPRLGTNDGKAALVPLPPLEEQQRIVVKLDELMALCDELSSIYIAPIELDQAVVKLVSKGEILPPRIGDSRVQQDCSLITSEQ
mgnify:CR=1 FL=1